MSERIETKWTASFVGRPWRGPAGRTIVGVAGAESGRRVSVEEKVA